MYLKYFKNLISVIEYFGGNKIEDESLLGDEKKMNVKNIMSATPEEEYTKIVNNKTMAVGLLKKSKRQTYDTLLINMHDQLAFNNDIYPIFYTSLTND